MHISIRQITSKKVCGNNVDFLTSEITPIKIRENQRGLFDHLNVSKKGTWKQRAFCDHRDSIEKSMWK